MTSWVFPPVTQVQSERARSIDYYWQVVPVVTGVAAQKKQAHEMAQILNRCRKWRILFLVDLVGYFGKNGKTKISEQTNKKQECSECRFADWNRCIVLQQRKIIGHDHRLPDRSYRGNRKGDENG